MLRRSVLAVTTCTLLLGSSTRPSPIQNPPSADDVTITVAPWDSVLIPYSGSDPDGDLFGFIRTSDLSDPSAGTLLESCVCRSVFGGDALVFICTCTTTFTAAS